MNAAAWLCAYFQSRRLTVVETMAIGDDGRHWRVNTNSGIYTIELRLMEPDVLPLTTRLTPSHDLLVAFWPRDLYPLDANDGPRQGHGKVEADQRGLNGGYCFLRLDRPAFGTVLFMQNLTTLNPFRRSTETKPDGIVGGEWPELGYQPPAAPMGNAPPRNPLKAGPEVVNQ